MLKTKNLATILAGAALLTACPAEDVKAVPAERAEPDRSDTPVETLHDFSDAIARVSERAVPSVVNIATTRTTESPHGRSPFENDPFFRHFFDFGPQQRQPQREQSLGSGVIVDAKGVILTNNHVVQGSDEIRVTLSDKRTFLAKVTGTDPKSDLAVLKIQDPPKDLTPIRFGDSDKLRLGEVVIAIGNPFGVGQTVTMGIVSAKGRANIGIVDYEDFIQTDAAINPGNSGGALVNLRGELVGINTAILSRTGGYQGIGFAIPSEMVENIMDSLLTEGKVVRGWLGVMIQDLTPELAKALDLEGTTGVLVAEVMPGAPAAKAGLRAKDVVISMDGEAVRSSAELRREVAGHRPGSKVEMTVLRDGDEETLTVQLGEIPGSEEQVAGSGGGPQSGLLQGLAMKDLDDSLRRRFEVAPRVDAGAVIVAVDPSSKAARAGLRPGDVIIEANRKKVDSVEELRDIVGAGGRAILLRVHRQGGSMFLVLKN